MGNRYVVDERYREGVVHIAPRFIKRASEENILELVARENNRALLGGNYNIYIGIKNTDYVLLHIKHNYYTVINKRVRSQKTGRWIHLPKRLCNDFHFTVNNGEVTTSPRVKHKSKRKTLYVYRIIISLILYECVDALDSQKDVHHIEKRYFNLVNCLRYVDASVHKKYHSHAGNKRKREGEIIESYTEFCELVNEIKRVDKISIIMPM